MLQFIVEAVAEILRNAGYLKTSHVTVYHNSIFLQPTYSKFKNISCYSLSNPQEIKSAGKWKFKNISCYSLSK